MDQLVVRAVPIELDVVTVHEYPPGAKLLTS